MRGASALQEVLDEHRQARVRVLVVWQSILSSDWAPPGGGILGRVHDERARQFWDKENLFPRRLGERIRSDKSHLEPRCCWHDDVPWDLVAVYPAGARWDDTLPPASFIDGPVYAMKAELARALQESELQKGRLP